LYACSGIWEDNKPPSKEPIRKHTSGGMAICLSACEDSQTAADSSVRIKLWSFFSLTCTSWWVLTNLIRRFLVERE